MITPFEKPVIVIDAPPAGIIAVPICSKSLWERLIYCVDGKSSRLRADTLRELVPDIGDKFPDCFVRSFLTEYRERIEQYCEDNRDIFAVPYRPDFESDDSCPLPVFTLGERIVHEHTGLDIMQINQLDILDYKMLLADAVKVNILRRADGKGKEYLNECYEYMHGISNIFSR